MAGNCWAFCVMSPPRTEHSDWCPLWGQTPSFTKMSQGVSAVSLPGVLLSFVFVVHLCLLFWHVLQSVKWSYFTLTFLFLYCWCNDYMFFIPFIFSFFPWSFSLYLTITWFSGFFPHLEVIHKNGWKDHLNKRIPSTKKMELIWFFGSLTVLK